MLKVSDVAAQLRIDYDAVLHLIATGQLVAVDVSKSPRRKRATWRITQAALDSFVAARSTRQPVASAPAPKRKRQAAGDVIQFFQ